jgi:hypothetical protein
LTAALSRLVTESGTVRQYDTELRSSDDVARVEPLAALIDWDESRP